MGTIYFLVSVAGTSESGHLREVDGEVIQTGEAGTPSRHERLSMIFHMYRLPTNIQASTPHATQACQGRSTNHMFTAEE